MTYTYAPGLAPLLYLRCPACAAVTWTAWSRIPQQGDPHQRIEGCCGPCGTIIVGTNSADAHSDLTGQSLHTGCGTLVRHPAAASIVRCTTRGPGVMTDTGCSASFFAGTKGRTPPVARFAGDLWLTAHDSTSSRPRLPSRTLGIALATGLLAELLLTERVVLDTGGRLRLHRPERPDDPALGPIVEEMSAEEHRRSRLPIQQQGLPGHDLTDWITFLAVDERAYGLVAERLAGAGALVREVRHALLGRRTQRWVPADSTVSGRPANRIAGLLERRRKEPLHLHDLIVAALYLATGLDGHALAIVDQDGRAELARQIASGLPAPVRELLRVADALIGESTMTGHR